MGRLGDWGRAPSMYANLVLVQGRNPESLRSWTFSKDEMHYERTVMLVGNIDALQWIETVGRRKMV